jgi:hypothetical protein
MPHLLLPRLLLFVSSQPETDAEGTLSSLLLPWSLLTDIGTSLVVDVHADV